MSPERLYEEWWCFLPGENFTDSRGETVYNDSENPMTIRVHELPGGLRIQAFGNNYHIEGAKNFEEVVIKVDKE